MKPFPGETAVQFEWRYQQALKRDREYWENFERMRRYGHGNLERDPDDEPDDGWSELAQKDAEQHYP